MTKFKEIYLAIIRTFIFWNTADSIIKDDQRLKLGFYHRHYHPLVILFI